MTILLKELLSEEDNETPLKVQIYCDMDGVLVDMEGGFKQISGGLAPKEYEAKYGKGSFWKVIGRKDRETNKPLHPNFWLDLKPMPDATTLWKFISENFKDPAPVILSAGQGAMIIQQKTQWIRNHISPTAKVIVAPAGYKKAEYIINDVGRVSHVLIDDTKKNIDAWDNPQQHRIGILHTDAASTISQLKAFLPDQK